MWGTKCSMRVRVCGASAAVLVGFPLTILHPSPIPPPQLAPPPPPCTQPSLLADAVPALATAQRLSDNEEVVVQTLSFLRNVATLKASQVCCALVFFGITDVGDATDSYVVPLPCPSCYRGRRPTLDSRPHVVPPQAV